jgi:hypothetical protein
LIAIKYKNTTVAVFAYIYLIFFGRLIFCSFLLIFSFVRPFVFGFKAVIVEGCSVIADWLCANLATKVAAACGHVVFHLKN